MARRDQIGARWRVAVGLMAAMVMIAGCSTSPESAEVAAPTPAAAAPTDAAATAPTAAPTVVDLESRTLLGCEATMTLAPSQTTELSLIHISEPTRPY